MRTDGVHISSQQEIAEEFGRFFSQVVGKVVEDWENCNLECDPNLNESKSKFESEEVKEENVLELLKGLDPNKACGVDGFGAKLLRIVAPGSLTSLFS